MILVDNLIGNDPDTRYFNSRGHRCKEIESIDLRNYILFIGDNVAIDFQHELEDTYPYIISSLLGMDYYNLAVFNGGVECMKFNLFSWLSKINQAPKAIIISSEFLNSFVIADKNFENISAGDFANSTVKDIFDRGNYNGFFAGRNELFDRLASKSTNTQIYQIVFKDKTPALSRNVVNILHDGNMFDHKFTASLVVNEIKKRQRSIAP